MKDECGQIRALEDIAKTIRRRDGYPFYLQCGLNALRAGDYAIAQSNIEFALELAQAAYRMRDKLCWRLLAVCTDIRSRGIDAWFRRKLIRTFRSKHFFVSTKFWPSDEFASWLFNEDEDEDEDEE